jgi:outer membrane receptor protein involved in Fe transport
MYVERMAFGLDGLGGPNCNQATGTPGVGGCLWFNPFSTAIQQSAINGATNPNFSAANDNPRELLDWMVGKQASEATNELLVFDAVVSGETPIDLGAGAIGWAAGFQARDESYNLSLNELTNLAESPCQFNNPRSVALGNVTQTAFDNCQNGLTTPTGPLAFLAGTVEEKTSRTIYAFFGELAIPVTDTIDMQAAIRFEDYGSETGSTVDPKIAIRWQALDWLAFRGTAQTTFRGPPQSLLSGRGTALAFITPAAAFKAVDTLGNPNLSPESAVATNLGVLFDVGGLYASVDWWRYELEDPISLESQDQIVTAYSTQGCQNGGAGAPDPDGAGPLPPTPTPSCEILRSHIFPLGTSVAALERVERNWINGADIDTSGIDAYVQYTFEGVLDGELTIGAQGSYTFEYESKDFLDINGLTLAPGGDFMGALNDGTPFTPKPDLKGDAFVKFTTGPHTASLIMRYVSDYDDKFAPTAAANGLTPDVCCDHLQSIDEQITFDAHYVVSLMEDNLVLSFSAINFTDEDPPLAATDLNYDPFTHDPRGIILKAGVQYRLGD